MVDIDKAVMNYLGRLSSEYDSINSIWLLGSRANGTNRTDSDWDFLIFADKKTLDSLKQSRSLKLKNVDVLVVYDKNKFEDPWSHKKGSLDNWKWKQLTKNKAKYWGIKWVSEGFSDGMENSRFDEGERTAIKIWPLQS